MSWWSRLVGGKSQSNVKPQRLDYLSEALALERQGDFDAALTSYRLALRDHPNDPRILQNIAIAYSKTGRLEEAIRAYRRALDVAPELSGAHYGLAFLLLKRKALAGAITPSISSSSRRRRNSRSCSRSRWTADTWSSSTRLPASDQSYRPCWQRAITSSCPCSANRSRSRPRRRSSRASAPPSRAVLAC